MNKKKTQQLPQATRGGVARKQEDLDLKSRLLSSPEMFITEKASDEYLDRLALKIKLGANEPNATNFIADAITAYEAKFKRYWWYRMADLYRVDRKVMEPYRKPEFARLFLLQFVYGRFPYMVLRMLRAKNRKVSTKENQIKLFQHLNHEANEQLDNVIEQVYIMMGQYKTPIEFKMAYSSAYKIYFQMDLGF
jgi:hypothetical protein